MNDYYEKIKTYKMIEKEDYILLLKDEESTLSFPIKENRNFILGIILRALDNGGFNTWDKIVAICEVNEIIDNADYDELKEEYKKWLREARYEKNTFRKISKRVCNFFNKDKRPE